MNLKRLALGAIFMTLFIQLSFSQKERLHKIVKRGETPVKLADGFSFTEGPAADKSGNVFFTDQPNNRIMMWSVDGKLSTFMQPSGRSNGLFFDSDGNLWSCADEKNELWCIHPDKKTDMIISSFSGKLLNGPNDLWIGPGGAVFFTDPFYKRSWWDHTEKPQEIQGVYYLSPDRATLKMVASDLVQPNGITGTSDGKILYVADIGAGKTYRYAINPDGSLSEKTLFCEMGSDGMTIDVQGNIYLTGKGVTVFDRNGTRIGNIPVPENWTANVCFGGKNRKELFITASKGLYAIKTRTKGAF